MEEQARKEQELKKLWQEFIETGDAQLRERLILEYAPLVKIVAGRLSVYFGTAVEYDDLVGYGVLGLIDAVDRFDLDKGVKFETYASVRIRGSIIDQIRKMDWIPRGIRQKQKQLDTVMRAIESKTGRPATDEQIAEALGITGDELESWQSQTAALGVASLDDYLDQGLDVGTKNLRSGMSRYESPEEHVDKSELAQALTAALGKLTERERRVIELFYYEELTSKEISCVLGVTESRISQLHSKALEKMKSEMGDYMDLLSQT